MAYFVSLDILEKNQRSKVVSDYKSLHLFPVINSTWGKPTEERVEQRQTTLKFASSSHNSLLRVLTSEVECPCFADTDPAVHSKPSQPHSSYCEQCPPGPLRILWEPSIAHTQGRCPPSAIQTDARWRSVRAWCSGRAERSRARWPRARAGTSSCCVAVSVLSSGYLCSWQKHILQRDCYHA